jgi:hypothetical protein
MAADGAIWPGREPGPRNEIVPGTKPMPGRQPGPRDAVGPDGGDPSD